MAMCDVTTKPWSTKQRALTSWTGVMNGMHPVGATGGVAIDSWHWRAWTCHADVCAPSRGSYWRQPPAGSGGDAKTKSVSAATRGCLRVEVVSASESGTLLATPPATRNAGQRAPPSSCARCFWPAAGRLF